jgi:hypothetical protein
MLLNNVLRFECYFDKILNKTNVIFGLICLISGFFRTFYKRFKFAIIDY